MVLSEAGNDPKVAGLVYLASFASQNEQSAMDALKGFAPGPGLAEAKPDAAGFLVLMPKGINEDFCQDLSALERNIVLARYRGRRVASVRRLIKRPGKLTVMVRCRH